MASVSGTRRATRTVGRSVARADMTWAARRRAIHPSTTSRQPGEPRWSWTVDMNSVFTWSSPESVSLIGYRPEELIGRHVDQVMNARELARAEAMMNAAGYAEDGVSNLIMSAVHRDGSAPWFEVTVQPTVDANGALVGFAGVSRYIGPDAARVVAARAARRRIEHVIDNGLLMTAFQPIVDVRTWTIVGVEALTRFVEEPGAAPDLWFAEAAAVGLGPTLELCATRTALTAAATLPPELYVSLNVSPLTCLDTSLQRILLESGIDPRRLILEVTEHSQVADYHPLTTVLAELRHSGIRIAVDDAGAGFSSGQHILKIKPDVIKLDRTIVASIDTEPGQRALAAGLLAFATYIGAQVVAEGVETPGESTCVRELGIQCIQGFLFGRPTVEPREWRTWGAPIPTSPNTTSPNTTSPTTTSPTTTSPTTTPPITATPITTTPPIVERRRAQDPGRQRAEPAPEPVHADVARSTAGWTSALQSAADGAGTPPPIRGHEGTARYGVLEASVLDALPDATAVLDLTGVIVAVNRAWRTFTLDSGGQQESSGVGVSYLDVCSRAASSGCTDALQALIGLQAVLSGETPRSESEYACDTPSGRRWFIARMTAMGGPGAGAVVSHVDISRRKRTEEELAHRASHDPLTGLANRLMFGERLAQALRRRPLHLHRPEVGVLYLDLDKFKPINDALGHSAGDDLLALVAHRLTKQVRASDTVARIGGDEFAICVPRISAQDLQLLGSRISTALGLPYRIHGRDLQVSVSVGTHLAAAGDSPAAALHAADRDMYRVKQRAIGQRASLRA